MNVFDDPAYACLEDGYNSLSHDDFAEDFDELLEELIVSDKTDGVSELDDVLDNHVEVVGHARSDIRVCHYDVQGVYTLPCNDLLDALDLTNGFEQELQCLLEGLRIVLEKHVSVVAEKEAKATPEDHSLGSIHDVDIVTCDRVSQQEGVHVARDR